MRQPHPPLHERPELRDRTRRQGSRLTTALLTVALLGTDAGARQEAPRGGADEPPGRAAAAAEAPPALSTAEEARLLRTLKKLTTSKEAAREKAVEEVVAFGRGALPVLVEEASTSHPDKQAGLLACLLALADARDREIVAAAQQSEHVVLRRFAARKSGELGLPELVAGLPPLLEDEDPQVRREAALALVAQGDETGLEQVAAAWVATLPAPPDPRKGGPMPEVDAEGLALQARILAVLPGVADQGRHAALAALLQRDPVREKEQPAEAAAERRAGVAMLAAIGDDAAVLALASALDDPHNLVQRDAIDALRRILEDAGPFQGGSIFAQIGEVERLKELVRRR